MRFKLCFIFLLLLTVVCYCNGQHEKLSIQIQNPASEFIMGEQIQFTLVWENTSDSPIRIAKGTRLRHSLLKLVLEGPVRKECEGLVTLVEEKVGYNSIINPHEKITISLVLRDLGIVNAGEYTMRAEFDSTKLESWWDKYSVDRIAVVSNTVKFRLVQPDGFDLQLFEKYKDKCNQITLKPEDLLHKYPTSTYAVYAFAKQFGGPKNIDPFDNEKMRNYLIKWQKDGKTELQDMTRHFATGADGKELKDAKGRPVTISEEQWLREQIALGESITSSHPELPVSEWIRAQVISPYYTRLMEFEKSASILRELKENAKDPVIREKSGQLLQLFSEMGLIAKHGS